MTRNPSNVGRVLLEHGRTNPLLRITPDNWRRVRDNLLNKPDRRPVGDIVRRLNKEGFFPYMGGSIMESSIYGERKFYEDIDLLALYDEEDKDCAEFIKGLRELENSFFRSGKTYFLTSRDFNQSGGYVGGEIDHRFDLRPMMSLRNSSYVRVPATRPIDLSFSSF